MLDKDFTSEEILNSNKHLKSSKAPGPDRFTNAYYKYFANILADPLVSACNYM